MIEKIDLKGDWAFCLDFPKRGISDSYFQRDLPDTIVLPTTVSAAKKGTPSEVEEVGFLTDPFAFEGYAWFSREVELANVEGKDVFLCLERTRVSQVWVDGTHVGSENSLCSTHRHRLNPFVRNGRQRITVLVDNSAYPVKGGHMTSPDTQTNWNGITGEISLEICSKARLEGLKIAPDAANRRLGIAVELLGDDAQSVQIRVRDNRGMVVRSERARVVPGANTFTIETGDKVERWSEHSPAVYELELSLGEGDSEKSERIVSCFGLRDFKAEGTKFTINGEECFLRGKHDGLIFPLTGYAPTDVESWLGVMSTAKAHGINHYRFHTACPPRAAFVAADRLGIYMEPELPFWGTVTAEGDEHHDGAGQEYLIREGRRIIDEFGNHPSFVMMSLGNELWGSKPRINEILALLKAYDGRRLYTQGSNNFQWVPEVLSNEDFFCGVRFSKERLFRGSYAMCDVPQGFVQTQAPTMSHDYDHMVRPCAAQGEISGGEITFQYGTGTKTVSADSAQELIPQVPVVSHEIGQYCTYPDFSEIAKYTGVLKARNFEVFQRRIEEKGMLHKAPAFFRASGQLAVDCYKLELEAALRSRELSGFQILDIQDFSGQGTALVGILNALMESKGLVSPEEWREFCSDEVLLGVFDSFVLESGSRFRAAIRLARFRPGTLASLRVKVRFTSAASAGQPGIDIVKYVEAKGNFARGVFELGSVEIDVPVVRGPRRVELEISMEGSTTRNHYELWVYPSAVPAASANGGWIETNEVATAIDALRDGKTVLLFPANIAETRSIEGTYCTDFWCYPMFRTISESMKRQIPIGTLGLLIEDTHPAFSNFPTLYHTSPQWYDVVSASRPVILDGLDVEPIVWTIDNFERNHRLGTLFEVNVGDGRAIVCTASLPALDKSLPARWLLAGLRAYAGDPRAKPRSSLTPQQFGAIFE